MYGCPFLRRSPRVCTAPLCYEEACWYARLPCLYEKALESVQQPLCAKRRASMYGCPVCTRRHPSMYGTPCVRRGVLVCTAARFYGEALEFARHPFCAKGRASMHGCPVCTTRPASMFGTPLVRRGVPVCTAARFYVTALVFVRDPFVRRGVLVCTAALFVVKGIRACTAPLWYEEAC